MYKGLVAAELVRWDARERREGRLRVCYVYRTVLEICRTSWAVKEILSRFFMGTWGSDLIMKYQNLENNSKSGNIVTRKILELGKIRIG